LHSPTSGAYAQKYYSPQQNDIFTRIKIGKKEAEIDHFSYFSKKLRKTAIFSNFFSKRY